MEGVNVIERERWNDGGWRGVRCWWLWRIACDLVSCSSAVEAQERIL